MAIIHQMHDINLLINNQSIFCSDLSLSQEADFSPVYNINESVTNKTTVNSPVKGKLNINYYFSGKDFLKDYLMTNSDYPLTGKIAGLFFNQGYLENYNLNVSPNSLININASLIICDEMSGNLSKIVPSGPPTGVTQCTSNEIIFNTSNFAAFTIENIRDFNWNYQANIKPIYFQKETGLSHINPDRIIISNKEISCSITTNSNNNNLLLPFTGDNYAIDMLVKHPTNTGIFETFSISGKISKKDFSIGQSQIGQSTYSITQNHINEEPKIDSIINTFLPNTGYFIINSPNLTNGYFSSNKKLPLIEKITLGGEQLKFNLNRGASTDSITGYTTNNSINGSLEVHTTKGLIIYPTNLTFNFSGIGVSGFTPDTGAYHDTITISGTNFFKISQVLFNTVPANFQIKQNTGIGGFHELIASVPENALVGKITVLSSLKNRSGISTGIFYPLPQITGLTPTGIWSGKFDVMGKNFSGITNVYFNNVNSLSFGVVSHSLITGRLPGTGAGFTKGYAKISGFKGMETSSWNIYHPIVPISGLSTISGTIDDDLAIYTIYDHDFLGIANSGIEYTGYKVAFGKVTGVFYRSGNSPNILTGLIPNNYFGQGYVSFFEPDNITKYPPFTGQFLQIGPAPIIDSFYPTEIYQYQTYTLNIEGQNFKDFFGIPYKAMINGVRQGEGTFNLKESKTGIYTYSSITNNNLHTKVTITGVIITGHTGYYDIYVRNFVGSGFITGLKVLSGIDWAQNNARITSQSQTNLFYSATMANDGNGYNSSSFSSTKGFNKTIGGNITIDSGFWIVVFKSPIDINILNFYQNPSYIADTMSIFNTNTFQYYNASLAKTGMMQLFDGGANICYTTGFNWNNKTYDFRYNPFTGISGVKLWVSKPNTDTCLAWNTIQIY